MQQPNMPPAKRKEGFIRSAVGGVTWLADFVDMAWAKFQNLTETNYRLACQMVQRGDLDEGIRRFKITLWLAPNHIPTLYNLGCLYLHTGNKKLALDHFVKVLRTQPNHEEAIFMVSGIKPELIRPEMQPRRMPPLMAIEYFDSQARIYDRDQQQRQYRMPVMVHQFMHAEMEGNFPRHDLLDLGCGTGLCGIQFRGEFNNIIGVDISNAMLDEAYRRLDDRGVKIYTRLMHQEARLAMREMKAESVDVVLAVSLFRYVGDLRGMFEGMHHVLRTGGYVVCSFDPFGQRASYGMLNRTGYFGHDVNYVVNLAQRAGFDIVRTGEVMGYPNGPAELCIFRKTASAAAPADETPPAAGTPYDPAPATGGS